MTGVSWLQNSQCYDAISFWCVNAATQVVYVTTTVAALGQNVPVVPLLQSGSGQVSGMLSATSVGPTAPAFLNSLLSVDQTGHITLMQQASDTNIWQTYPFFTPNAVQNVSIQSYTDNSYSVQLEQRSSWSVANFFKLQRLHASNHQRTVGTTQHGGRSLLHQRSWRANAHRANLRYLRPNDNCDKPATEWH